MPTRLHLGDESQIKMPDMFGHLNPAALRRAQAVAQSALPIPGERYREVKLSAITEDSPLQVRAPFDPEQDEDDRALLESLEGDGQRVPVLLVEDPDSQAPAFTILDGHRRIAALRRLNRETVKAVVFDQETVECDLITLTANVRKHLTPLQQARAIARLRERHQLTVEEIARRVGLTPRYLSELKALVETDPTLQAALESGSIKAKTALALGQAPREHQPRLAEIAAAHGLSEAEAKRLVTRLHDTSETPEQAARALGFIPAESQPDEEHPSVPRVTHEAQRETASSPPASKHRHKRGQGLTTEAAVTLIQSGFPEIEARAAQSLAELAVQQSANANVLKAATLLTLGGLKMETAIKTAWATANDPGVRKLLRVVDAFIDARTVILDKARCASEYAPMLGAIAKQAAGLKQAVARMKPKKKDKRHGTPQSAE